MSIINKESDALTFEPRISYFENCLNPTPTGVVTFKEFIDVIRSERFKEVITIIRSEPDKSKRHELKKRLAGVTVSGEFDKRSSQNLIKHSGLIQMDFDDVEDLEASIEKLKKDEYVYSLFKSPSGNGIKVFVRIPPYEITHKSLFKLTRKYFKKLYNLAADAKCEDIPRLCFASYDPDAYYNANALEFADDTPSSQAELRDYVGKAEDYPVDLLYRTTKDDYGNVKYITIRHARFLQFIEVLGFHRFDLGTGFVFVRIKDNVIVEVSKTTIQDVFFDFIKGLPDDLPDGISYEALYEKLVKSIDNYFSDVKLSIIKRIEPIFCNDTAEEVKFFYANGFVRCTKDGYKLHPYSETGGLVWKNQILTRNFEIAKTAYNEPDNLPVFAKFIWNVSGKDFERFKSFRTLIGYLLHDFFEGKTRAIILTDSDITTYSNGRTGKTLFAKALSHVTPLCEINGKDFNPEERFKYQEVSYSDRIIHINDIKKSLSIEKFFVDITEGLSVQKKNKQPFRKRAKIIISTNRTMKIEGASARDRVIEIEFSNHYGEILSPQTEFGKWFFGDGWNDFDNFICSCVCSYLQEGVHIPTQINLGRRKLLASSNEDFIEFLDQRVKDKLICANQLICKNELKDEFLKEYAEYKETLKDVSKVTVWLRDYANLSGYFAMNNPKQDEKAANGKKYFVFREPNYRRTTSVQFVQQTTEFTSDLIGE
jgi:hypothetical protein